MQHNTLQDLDKLIAETENQIAERNKAIARMEEALDSFGEEPNEWYRSCSFNLKKAYLERDTLDGKLQKLLSNQRHLMQMEQTALFKKRQAEENHALDLKRIEAAKIAKKIDHDARQINAIEFNERRFIELRRLIIPIIGEEKTFSMTADAERLAHEWIDKRAQKTNLGV